MLIPAALAAALPPGTLAAVGGAVRDHLTRQHASPDIDLTTTLTPEELTAALTAAGIGFNAAHIQFGTVTAHLPSGPVEITSTRRENYGDSRYPQTRFGVTFAEDAPRRDFTINAIYLFPDGKVFDPTGGRQDLAAGCVRFIGNPAQRLKEDPLRLYRFARFCAYYGLDGWTPAVDAALKVAAPAAQKLSAKKVAQELAKLRTGPHAAAVQTRLRRLGLVPTLPPPPKAVR